MKKPNVNYKILALLLLLGTTGCKGYKHNNVIVEKRANKMLVRDVETGRERIYTTELGNDISTTGVRNNILPYLAVGDTIKLGSLAYDKHNVLTPINSDLYFDRKTIIQRREDTIFWREFNLQWQQIMQKHDDNNNSK